MKFPNKGIVKVFEALFPKRILNRWGRCPNCHMSKFNVAYMKKGVAKLMQKKQLADFVSLDDDIAQTLGELFMET